MSLIDKKQVAQYFNVTERTINNWVEKKIITPVIRINNRPKFSKEAIDEMVKKGSDSKSQNENAQQQ
jgi:DNA-binding transcriptional MerR regulator